MLDLQASSTYLDAFDRCYRPRVSFGESAHYEQIALPARGGALDQPAMLMTALDIVERVSTEELQTAVDDAGKKTKTPSHD